MGVSLRLQRMALQQDYKPFVDAVGTTQADGLPPLQQRGIKRQNDAGFGRKAAEDLRQSTCRNVVGPYAVRACGRAFGLRLRAAYAHRSDRQQHTSASAADILQNTALHRPDLQKLHGASEDRAERRREKDTTNANIFCTPAWGYAMVVSARQDLQGLAALRD
jgi:hypothetical protein